MTAPLAEFRLAQPGTVKEAVAACLKYPGSRFVAGGTDLLVNMRRGISSPDLLVDLSGIDELAEIATDARGVTIGAGVTLAALAATRRSPANIARSRKPPPRSPDPAIA